MSESWSNSTQLSLFLPNSTVSTEQCRAKTSPSPHPKKTIASQKIENKSKLQILSSFAV